MYLIPLLILLMVLLVILFFFVIEFYNIIFRGFAPFVSTPNEDVDLIIKEINIDPHAVVYELGVGNAPFLRKLRKKYPEAELCGVEYSFLPYLTAQIQNSFSQSKIKLIKKNFFRVNLGKANVIYCYLNQKTMKRLESKIKKECPQGTLIISYLYPFPNLNPEKIIDLKNKNQKAYFYVLV